MRPPADPGRRLGEASPRNVVERGSTAAGARYGRSGTCCQFLSGPALGNLKRNWLPWATCGETTWEVRGAQEPQMLQPQPRESPLPSSQTGE